MKINMKFEGGADLARQLERLPKELSRPIKLAALKEAAEPIRQEASVRAPRSNRSGSHLKDHIVIGVPTEKQLSARGRETETVVVVGPDKNHFYGFFQELADEYGGIRHAAQPFMRPAFDVMAPKSLGILADELWWGIRHGINEKFVA